MEREEPNNKVTYWNNISDRSSRDDILLDAETYKWKKNDDGEIRAYRKKGREEQQKPMAGLVNNFWIKAGTYY